MRRGGPGERLLVAGVGAAVDSTELRPVPCGEGGLAGGWWVWRFPRGGGCRGSAGGYGQVRAGRGLPEAVGAAARADGSGCWFAGAVPP